MDNFTKNSEPTFLLKKYIVKSTVFLKKNRHCEGKCIFENIHLHWKCFKVQLSVALSVYILSSKGANQLQVLYIRTLENIQGNVSTEGAILKCISNFFLEVLGQVKACFGKLCFTIYTQ